MRAKTFAVLCHLAERPGRVVGKDALFDAIWPGLSVTEDTLTQSIRELRVALGPAGAAALRTVPRRGFVLDVEQDSGGTQPPGDGPPLLLILPFVAADPADAPLADGLVEEITHAAARYGLIRVIARHTAFRFPAGTLPPAEAARHLGADYFVEGTARRLGGDLHLSPCLCQTAGARQIWGEGFRLSPTGFRDLPALVAQRIVSRLSLDVERHLPSGGSGAGDLGAWQHFMAGLVLLRQYGEGVNERARDHLDEALRLDPQFALAWAHRGLAEVIIGRYGEAPPEVLDRALDFARRGVELAPEESRCHWIIGVVRLFLRQHAAAELHLIRAQDLNPSDPDVLALRGYVAALRGRAAEGVDWLHRAVDLNPLHPAWYHQDLSIALHLAGRPAEALAHLLMLPRTDAVWHRRIAACHAALGDLSSAARSMAKAQEISPSADPVTAYGAGLEVEHPALAEPILRDMAAALAAWRSQGDA